MVNKDSDSNRRGSDSGLTRSISLLIFGAAISLCVTGAIGLFNAMTTIAVLETEIIHIKQRLTDHKAEDERIHKGMWDRVNAANGNGN